MPTETSQQVLNIADSVSSNKSLIFTDSQALQNSVLNDLTAKGFTLDERTLVSELMQANATGEVVQQDNGLDMVQALAPELYLSVTSDYLKQSKFAQAALIDSITTSSQSFGGVAVGNAIGNYIATSTNTTTTIVPNKIPVLAGALGTTAAALTVGSGVYDTLTSDNPNAAALKNYVAITAGAVATVFIAPVIVPSMGVLFGSTLAGVVGGFISTQIDKTWENIDFNTIANDIQNGVITAAEAAQDIANQVGDAIDGVLDATGQEALDLMEGAKDAYGDVADSVSDILDDYGWALGDLLKELPDWVQGVLNRMDTAANTGSPLVLDLDGDGIELAALNGVGSVYWDIDVDGFAEASGWISGGDGLLAIDLNNDGYINNHDELFGDQSGAPNGFATLAAYDTNNNGTITAADAQYSDLLIWVDNNTDGVSQQGELHTLNDLGISSINLNYSDVSYEVNGNEIKQESTFTINGQTRSIVDAYFAYDNANTVYVEGFDLNVETIFLPALRGYGTIPDLYISMSQDQVLLDMVQAFSEVDVQTLLSDEYDFVSKMEDIMYRWAKVDDVAIDSRGGSIDARKLEFLEEFVGEKWRENNPNPGPDQANVLRQAFGSVLASFSTQLFVQTDAKILFDPLAAYNPFTGVIEGEITASQFHISEVDNEIFNSFSPFLSALYIPLMAVENSIPLSVCV